MSKQKIKGIKWTDETINPISLIDDNGKFAGWWCQKISPACSNCYAEAMSKRYHRVSYSSPIPEGKRLVLREDFLQNIVRTKAEKVFISDMTDLFGDWVPSEWIQQVFQACGENPTTQFQLLTKRPGRMFDEICDRSSRVPVNIWFGATTENQEYFDKRIDALLSIKEVIDNPIWVSVEPMLSPIKIHPLLDWVVCGGESGSKAKRKRREMKKEWALDLRDQCAEHNTPYFFKQWNCRYQNEYDNILEGKYYMEFPKILSTIK